MNLSRFRILQNKEIKIFADKCKGKDVVELGGTFKENNGKFFDKSKSFLITNYFDQNCHRIEDVRNLSFENDTIEAIICISVIQHVYDYEKAISEIIRVLKPGGIALITNGYLFPICMEFDYYRFTPFWWSETMKNYPVQIEIKNLGNRFTTIENLLMRPYNRLGGIIGLMNKMIGLVFTVLGKLKSSKDDYPLGVSISIIKKN